MGAFEYKALRQRRKVDLVRVLPYAKQRDKVLAADTFFNICPRAEFVRQFAVQRVAVVQLEPLNLLAVQHRRVKMEPQACFGVVKALEVCFVRQPAEPSAFSQIHKEFARIG